MNFDDLYPSKYLKQADVPEPIVVTIEGVKIVNMARDDQKEELKPIVKFREFDKPMAMNKTNGKRIAEQHGPNTEEWKGKKMELYVNPDVQFGDETTGGLRLRASGKKTASTAPARTNDFDSDVPF